MSTGDEQETVPVAVWSGELTMSGVTLHAHVLDDGTRIIEADDLAALMKAWEDGAPLEDEETAAFARWRSGINPEENDEHQ